MTLPPLRRQVLAACTPEDAFTLFVFGMGSWWPLATHGCFGEGSTVDVGGSEFVETGPHGQRAVWGTILEKNEPKSIEFTWHPGKEPDHASLVRVRFEPSHNSTLVTLDHSNWESFPDAAAAREDYGSGWIDVLNLFANAAQNRR